MSLNPITRKEIFMAKAAGEKVPDVTPVTREEIFLSRIAGGGSGGGSADLLNADGVIKQEHLPEGYPYETRQSAVIVPSGLEYIFDEEMGAFVSTGEIVQPTIGEEYTVMWNGTSYPCVARFFEGFDVVFGDLGIVTGGGKHWRAVSYIGSDTDNECNIRIHKLSYSV